MEKSNFSWDKERSQILKIQAEEGNLLQSHPASKQQNLCSPHPIMINGDVHEDRPPTWGGDTYNRLNPGQAGKWACRHSGSAFHKVLPMTIQPSTFTPPSVVIPSINMGPGDSPAHSESLWQSHLAAVITLRICKAELTSWVCDLYSLAEPCAQKGPVLGSKLCCHHLETFNNFLTRSLQIMSPVMLTGPGGCFWLSGGQGKVAPGYILAAEHPCVF